MIGSVLYVDAAGVAVPGPSPEQLKTIRYLGNIGCEPRLVASRLLMRESELLTMFEQHPIAKEAYEGGKREGLEEIRQALARLPKRRRR